MTETGTVRSAVVTALAQAHGKSVGQVEDAIAAGGGDAAFELDSKTAEWITVFVELALTPGTKLPTPAEMGKDQIATVGALVRALESAIGCKIGT